MSFPFQVMYLRADVVEVPPGLQVLQHHCVLLTQHRQEPRVRGEVALEHCRVGTRPLGRGQVGHLDR